MNQTEDSDLCIAEGKLQQSVSRVHVALMLSYVMVLKVIVKKDTAIHLQCYIRSYRRRLCEESTALHVINKQCKRCRTVISSGN